jgi:hypothetical protein
MADGVSPTANKHRRQLQVDIAVGRVLLPPGASQPSGAPPPPETLRPCFTRLHASPKLRMFCCWSGQHTSTTTNYDPAQPPVRESTLRVKEARQRGFSSTTASGSTRSQSSITFRLRLSSVVCRLSSLLQRYRHHMLHNHGSRKPPEYIRGHRGLGWPVSRTAWQIKQATASMHTSSRGQEYSRANSFADIEQYYHVHCSQYHPLLPCYADRHTQRGHSMYVVCARQARVNSVPGYLPPAFGP